MTNEQTALAIQAGKTALLEPFWHDNRGLAYSVAKRYRNAAEAYRAADMEDLLQACFLGFCEAVERFEEGRGAFSTVAIWCMKRECAKALGLVGRPRVDMGCKPLDIPFQDDPTGPLKVDMLVDESLPNMDELAIMDDAAKCVRAEVEALPEPDRSVVKLHYFNGCTFRDIADVLGYEKWDQALRIEGRALRKLRYNNRLRQLMDFRLYHAPELGSFYAKRGAGSFAVSQESVVEMLAIKREKIKAMMDGITI